MHNFFPCQLLFPDISQFKHITTRPPFFCNGLVVSEMTCRIFWLDWIMRSFTGAQGLTKQQRWDIHLELPSGLSRNVVCG